MIIKYFKLFESRSSELSESEFLNILNENCKNFKSDPFPITRSKREPGHKFSYINPKEHAREPLKYQSASDVLDANGQVVEHIEGVHSNHVQVIIDELPSWSEFPKRRNSIIGSSGFYTRTLFGKQKFFVIPFDGAKFGVSPGRDLWIPSMKDTYNITLNDRFTYILKHNEISDENIDIMLKDIEAYYRAYLKGKVKSGPYNPLYTFIRLAVQNKIDPKDIKDFFNIKFSPTNFTNQGQTYQVMDIDQVRDLCKKTDSLSKEIWTDSECLIVYVDDKLMSDLRKKFNELKEMIK